MRVTGGVLRGRRLSCPKGSAVRPTTDRVREALFDIISSNYIEDWQHVNAMDLFAGTGALGIEALSRGAKGCVFVEGARAALKVLEKNLCMVRDLGCSVKVLSRSVYSLPKYLDENRIVPKVNLVFADPPYAKGHLKRLLSVLSEAEKMLDDNVLIVMEEDKRTEFPEAKGFELLQKRVYGDTALFFIGKDKGKWSE